MPQIDRACDLGGKRGVLVGGGCATTESRGLPGSAFPVDRRSWRCGGGDDGVAGPASLVAYPICTPAALEITRVSSAPQSRDTVGDLGPVQVSCPPVRTLVGGGCEVDDSRLLLSVSGVLPGLGTWSCKSKHTEPAPRPRALRREVTAQPRARGARTR